MNARLRQHRGSLARTLPALACVCLAALACTGCNAVAELVAGGFYTSGWEQYRGELPPDHRHAWVHRQTIEHAR